MRKLTFALLFAIVAGDAVASEPVTFEGKVKEVSGGPFGRGQPILQTTGGEKLVLEGATGAKTSELLRLSGLIVSVTGKRTDVEGRLVVDHYEITDIGRGVRPRVGHFATIMLDGTRRMLFVDIDGQADVLPAGWTKRMLRHVGAKAWMHGTRGNKAFQPSRFGILAPRDRGQQLDAGGAGSAP